VPASKSRAHARIYPITGQIDRRFWVGRVSAGQRMWAESADQDGAIVIPLVQAYQVSNDATKTYFFIAVCGAFCAAG